MREWLSWWSTTLPRSGPRVRVPSRADKIKRLSQWIVALFYQHEMFWNPHNFIMRVPEKVHRTFSHLALCTRAKLRFGGFRKQSTGLFSISRLLKLRLFYSPNLRLLASTANTGFFGIFGWIIH